MDNQPKDTILSVYRILDLTDGKGMFCAELLADMGAEVIRVEEPRGKSVEEDRQNPSFCYLNAGKRGVSLDFRVRAGNELFKRLVRTADAVVEDKPPGKLADLGIGYSELSEINPGLVMASITDFGQNGPYRDYKSCDMVASALGGQMYVCGEHETSPLKPFGNQAYYSACLFAANGILLALWDRHATGKGQHIDVSVMECVTATLDHVLVRYFYEGVVAKRQGSHHWNNAFRIFHCRDGHILLSLFQQWETLVEWLDAEGMAEDLTDKKWLSRKERLKQLDHITEVLERWTLSHTVSELVEKGQLMRFPWAEVNSVSKLVNNPQLAERNFFVDIECSESGEKNKSAGAPCRLSRSPWCAGGRVPRAGEHDMEIYGELGLSPREIETLKRDGVI